ncbi:nucleotidyltransferase [Arthrobacter sp. M4]|uniref:nucleotidyltransferase domain-containing protein n=1 Tax=Arthrobacter sp. M4 TaxID=218160 RepID=UPI001CDCD51E|nr:nucleotidyltransferase [Arthrobacter sp. M4]MCA4131298.1 nucleotidyltransferase [Arthrobacter sp. M4]
MTILADTRGEQISQLIGTTIEQLDITDAAFAAAERCYHDLGSHLAEASAEVHVQGSFLLGTVVRPHHRDGEYDLDLVSRLDVAKTSITQQELKERVGSLLATYHKEHDGEGCESPKEVSEGRRSWCLHYSNFHMDVLPAIPDTASTSETAIELTDRNLRLWQKSDPLAYVEWFRRQCAKQFAEERVVMAKSYGSVDAVPKHRVRTPLHRVVQILKRHRDIYFADDLDDRPPSSLITTLAGLSYIGETDLITATMAAVQRMPDHVEKRSGQYWVENPVCAGENFADKWNDYEARRLKFETWRAAVEEDLISFMEETNGAVALHERIAKAFGNAPVEEAVKAIGARTNVARETGNVHFGSGGLLTTTVTATAVPTHRFFGGETAR